MPLEKLGQMQKALIQGLKRLGVEQEIITPIIALANTDEKADKMIDWLVENQEATDEEILDKAEELSPELVQHY